MSKVRRRKRITMIHVACANIFVGTRVQRLTLVLLLQVIEPVVCLSIDFYIRVFVRVRHNRKAVLSVSSRCVFSPSPSRPRVH
jgi:hypothetical protein